MPRPERIEIDTDYLGIAGAASAFLVRGPRAPVLVECGCAVSHDALRARLAAHGVAPRELAAVLVTHVHLDHAGGAGHLAREGVQVLVHPRGARHLVDPARLIAGSRAVHGPRYARHYGDPLPIDADLVRAVGDGETIEVGGLAFTAIGTPGHARHHHAWAEAMPGAPVHAVHAGDALGMRSPGSAFVSLPLPPSDIDIPAWRASLERLRALPQGVEALLTHGGARPLHAHLEAFVARMNEELPLLAELAAVADRDAPAADARYRDFLLPRARAAGLPDDRVALLLGNAYRSMNIAGIAGAIAAGRFEPRVG